jgi:hypothetical protein
LNPEPETPPPTTTNFIEATDPDHDEWPDEELVAAITGNCCDCPSDLQETTMPTLDDIDLW